MLYQVIFDDKEKFQVKQEHGNILVNDKVINWDLISIDKNVYHLLYNNKSYTVEIREKEEGKKFSVRLNGKPAKPELKDKLDILLEKMGLDTGDSGKLQSIKAPMPGLIMEIKVKPGDEVKKGDQLLILEAMKMENIIKSPGEGVVKAINVKKGDGVEKNQVMIQF